MPLHRPLPLGDDDTPLDAAASALGSHRTMLSLAICTYNIAMMRAKNSLAEALSISTAACGLCPFSENG
jgi:hypothetical protein